MLLGCLKLCGCHNLVSFYMIVKPLYIVAKSFYNFVQMKALLPAFLPRWKPRYQQSLNKCLFKDYLL